jgi:hypothetical protein
VSATAWSLSFGPSTRLNTRKRKVMAAIQWRAGQARAVAQ